jgi:hypothetical protein
VGRGLGELEITAAAAALHFWLLRDWLTWMHSSTATHDLRQHVPYCRNRSDCV